VRPTITEAPSASARDLLASGFVHVRGCHESKAAAWQAAREVFAAAALADPIGAQMPALEVVGEFSLPPPGARRRDFQALHIDFGLPVSFRQPVDVARFTALYIDPLRPPTSAMTRVVPLRSLLGQRAWSDRATVLGRVSRSGPTNGGQAVEGILARLVEAADDHATLPSTVDPGFLCGMEFASREEERSHFARHGVDLDAVEARVRLAPGELLLLDNLAAAHGRIGRREPEELQQLCVGYRALDPARQRTVLGRVLEAFE
jgi:hypothetical protein